MEEDFYVIQGECISCGAPEAMAPDLMDHDGSEDRYHCRFKRQPETPEELQQAIAAVCASCCGAVTYRGSDTYILNKLAAGNAAYLMGGWGSVDDPSLLGDSLIHLSPSPLLRRRPWLHRLAIWAAILVAATAFCAAVFTTHPTVFGAWACYSAIFVIMFLLAIAKRADKGW